MGFLAINECDNQQCPVDSLFDLSGAGNHLYAPSLDNRPVLLTDEINGYPVINFDGIQQYLLDPLPDTSFKNTEATLIAVAERNNQGSLVSISTANSSDEFLILNNNIYHHSSPFNWNYLGNQCTADDTLSEYVIITGVLGTSVDDIQNLHFRIPSTLDAVPNGTPVPFSSSDRLVHIGQRDVFYSSEFLVGNFVELLGYNRKLNPVEIDSVITYLENKYEISEHRVSVGVTDIDQSAGLNVYPNPTAGSFTVTSEGTVMNGTIEVFSATGKTVHQSDIRGLTQKEVDLQGLAQGVYTVKVLDGKKHVLQEVGCWSGLSGTNRSNTPRASISGSSVHARAPLYREHSPSPCHQTKAVHLNHATRAHSLYRK